MIKKFEARGFKIAIADQASYIKHYESEWSKTLMPFLFALRRVLLLTGSNFQHNPFEIYNLLKIVRPDYMPDFLKYCLRYCDPIKKKDGVEFMGKSFHHELSLLYKKRFAVRHCSDEEDLDVPGFYR